MASVAEPYGSGLELSICAHRWLNDDATQCYVNASVSAWLWSLLLIDLPGKTLDPWLLSICQYLARPHPDGDVLFNGEWAQPIFQKWKASGQCDAAEFTQLLIASVQHLPHCNMCWDKRADRTDGDSRFDQNVEQTPLLFKLALNHSCTVDSVAFQELCDIWRQDDGMVRALLTPSDVVCVHIDRTRQPSPTGVVQKHAFCVTNLGNWLIPVFQDAGADVHMVKYETMAVVTHLGDPSSGRYKAALRVLPGRMWFLTEDNTKPQIATSMPLQFTMNATIVWLRRIQSDVADIMDTLQSLP